MQLFFQKQKEQYKENYQLISIIKINIEKPKENTSKLIQQCIKKKKVLTKSSSQECKESTTSMESQPHLNIKKDNSKSI